jgi:hypothetical protein
MLGRGKIYETEETNRTVGFFYSPMIGPDTGIMVTDENGYIFTEYVIALGKHGNELPPIVLEHPDEFVNELIRNYDLVVVTYNWEGDKMCFSRKHRNRLPRQLLELIRFAQVMPADTILWADDVFKTPEPALAREVIYGERPERDEQERQRKSSIASKWQHPDALSSEEMDLLTGKESNPKANDAVMALVALGFKQGQAQSAVRKAQAELGEQATVEEIVRACFHKGG